MVEALDKVHCDCGKWVMRYEAGAIHVICTRCKADVALDVKWLIARLEAESILNAKIVSELGRAKKEAVCVKRKENKRKRMRLVG